MSRLLEPVRHAQAVIRPGGYFWSASARSRSWRMKRGYGTPDERRGGTSGKNK